MARPIKKGFDYFPFDVGFFRNIKIRITLLRFGAGGVLLFIYLLTVIYCQGYYIEYNEDLLYIASDDLQMKPEKIGQIINFFCKRSLFDGKLFTTDKVITSKGIQLRYQQMVKARALKNPVTVNERFWLLEKNETETFIKVLPKNDNSEKNESNSKKNKSNSKKNGSKVNIKESKAKQSKAATAADAVCCNKTESSYFTVTGRHLTESEKEIVLQFIHDGCSDESIAQIISNVGQRSNKKINSFNYFVPVIKEKISNGDSEDGRYPSTYDTKVIEDILNAEWMSESVGDDSDYNYDD